MNFIFPALMVAMTIAAFLRQQPPPWHEWVWLAAYWAQAIIRAPHAKRNVANVVTGDKRDVSEKIALAAMFLTMGALPIIEVGTNVFGFADYALPLWAAIIGALLQIPFLWLFWRSHADLGGTGARRSKPAKAMSLLPMVSTPASATRCMRRSGARQLRSLCSCRTG